MKPNQLLRAVAAAFVLFLVGSPSTLAQVTNSWISPVGGLWDSPGAWSLGTPTNYQTVVFTNAGSGSKSITINNTHSFQTNMMTISNLVVSGTATNTNTLSLVNVTNAPFTVLRDVRMTTNSALTLNNSRMQMSGGASSAFLFDGTVTMLNGSVLQNSGSMYVAGISGGAGTLNMTNSYMTNVNMWVGASGTARGTVNQSGGSNIVKELTVGYSSGGTGTYNLLNGYVATRGGETFVGRFGTGTMNTTNSIVVNSGDTYVGWNGTGTWNQVGGTNSVSTALWVGLLSPSLGAYNLYSGDLWAGGLTVGYSGVGAVNQTGGRVVVTNGLWMGQSSFGGSGNYNLNGGSLDAFDLFIGYGGNGVFVQNGGTNTVGSRLSVGKEYAATDGNGVYNLTNGFVSANNFTVADGVFSSTGVVNQAGGTVVVTNDLLLASVSANNRGTYNLSGGNLNAWSVSVGNNGVGVFNQTGGAHTNEVLSLGTYSGSSGTYNLANGTLQSGAQYIGDVADSTFNQSGGTNTTGSVAVGYLGQGTYNLSNGVLNAQYTDVGVLATGVFNQMKGSNYSRFLSIGWDAAGFYNMSNGMLRTFETAIGLGTSGSFSQDGGTNIADSDVVLGTDTGGRGSYFQNRGYLYTPVVWLGFSAGTSGTFTQSFATNYINTLSVGNANGATGSYRLTTSAGVLNVNTENIGNGGNGSFVQLAGTHRVTNTLTIGSSATSTGYFQLLGSLIVSNMDVGSQGDATMNLIGGSLAASGRFTVARFNGSSATLNQSGGTLTAPVVSVNAGGVYNLSNGTATAAMDNRGVINQYGGTLLNGLRNMTNRGSFSFYNGTFNGSLFNYGAFNVYSNFNASGLLKNYSSIATTNAISAVGGVDNAGTIALGGGTLSSSMNSITNNGLISGWGTISGTSGLKNNGVISVAYGHFTLDNTGFNQNNGSIDLASGYQFRLDGGDLNNNGSFNLNGGIVSGSGLLVNGIGGTVRGRGAILSSFENAGGLLLVEDGNVNVINGFANDGIVQLTTPAANLSGGTLENGGTVQGVGNIGNAIDNHGIVEAVGGTLVLSGNVINHTDGLITAATGNKVLVNFGLPTNAGTINLAGGTFDNNNRALDNGGQISGNGLFRASQFRNYGRMTFSGGNSTIYGNVMNAAGARVEVVRSGALFTGNVTNYGIFKTTAASVTFAGAYEENGSYISDPSDNYFLDLILGATGYLVGGLGDNFFVQGNLLNHSTQSSLWDTEDARLAFNGSGSHLLQLAGADLGRTGAGYLDNFSWGILDLGNGQTLTLQDGNATAGGAIYVRSLFLGGGTNQIGNITGNGLNIYYDATRTENAYLQGKTYNLTGGGELAPIVEQLRILSIQRAPSQATIVFEALAGRTNVVQFSANLSSWTNVLGASFTTPSAGQLQWIDDGSLTGGLSDIRFYRVLAQ